MRVPGEAFDVEPAGVRLPVAGCDERRAPGAVTSRGIRALLLSCRSPWGR